MLNGFCSRIFRARHAIFHSIRSQSRSFMFQRLPSSVVIFWYTSKTRLFFFSFKGSFSIQLMSQNRETTVCEGKSKNLKCNDGGKLEIKYANYGRTNLYACAKNQANKSCRSKRFVLNTTLISVNSNLNLSPQKSISGRCLPKARVIIPSLLYYFFWIRQHGYELCYMADPFKGNVSI